MYWMVKGGGRDEDVSRSGFTENFEGVTSIEGGDGQVKEIDGRASDFKGEFNGRVQGIDMGKEILYEIGGTSP